MRRLLCWVRHDWSSWRTHESGCGTSGCTHLTRSCRRCHTWQHRFPDETDFR